MSKHTPGPWLVNGNVIRGDAQSNGSVSVACILDVAYPYGRRAGESAQANARLIAAAPELLEALRLAEAALADIGDADREPGDDLAWCEARAAQALPAIRAAIAKATGKTP